MKMKLGQKIRTLGNRVFRNWQRINGVLDSPVERCAFVRQKVADEGFCLFYFWGFVGFWVVCCLFFCFFVVVLCLVCGGGGGGGGGGEGGAVGRTLTSLL